MSNDFLIRNSLYGFNKEDVISYIEKIKQESQSYKDAKNKMKEDLEFAYERIQNLEKKVNDFEQEYQRIQKQKNSEDMLKLKDENEELKNIIEDLSTECDKYRKSSKQFNSLILDAYIQSENILKDAREKAKNIANDTKGVVREATVDIEGFSDYINNISSDFSEIVSELTSNIKKLTGNLINATEGISELNTEKDQEILDGFEELINHYTTDEKDENVKEKSNEVKDVIEDNEQSGVEDKTQENIKENQEINGVCSSVKYEYDKIINRIEEYISNDSETETDKKSNKVKVIIKSNKNNKG